MAVKIDMNILNLDEIIIRRINHKDEAALGVFFETVLRHTYIKEDLMSFESEMLQEIEIKKEYVKADLSSNGKRRFLLLAEHQGQILGTLSIGAADENDIIRERAPELSQLYELGTAFILPEVQNKGIITKLIEDMRLELISRGETAFCLDSGYPTAQKIWTKKFGAPSYHLKDYWGAGSDHMIWDVKL